MHFKKQKEDRGVVAWLTLSLTLSDGLSEKDML